ncbi:MAG: hypothetical protein JST94_01235 [Bacteroidetes bacterium]|nr:hypothetical protein [Bacteroidota bacterium]MCB0536442.1 hypothetical protein [Bacteroidota bacterium]TXH53866.1 MAG: hypothetical protein E6Q89_08930 [Bacteroidia bacterium]
MKQTTKTFATIVLLAGIAVIFAGFFLLVPEEKRNEIFWLDLIVTCFVFTISCVIELGLIANSAFDKQVGGLGIRLSYIRLYSLLAIAIIVIGYFAKAIFNYQLFFQLAAAFILLLGYFFSHLSSSHTSSVQAEQDIQRKGKDEIIKAISQFEMLISKDSNKFGAEKQKIETIKETVRYLSPTNNSSANELDAEIISSIQQAYSVAKNNDNGRTEVFSLLNKCEELLKLRKNTYSN